MQNVELTEESDWWVATHKDTNVTSQGPTRGEALQNLGEALALHDEANEELKRHSGPDNPPDVPWF